MIVHVSIQGTPHPARDSLPVTELQIEEFEDSVEKCRIQATR